MLSQIFQTLDNEDIKFVCEVTNLSSDFLKVKDKLFDAIKKYGNITEQWINNKLNELGYNNFKDAEKSVLTYQGIFGFKVNKLIYIHNAIYATLLTKNVLDLNGNNGEIGKYMDGCRGNAVKHAALNILNANDFGRNMAKALGDAHETGESNSPYPNVTMDLHNNSIGLKLYDDNFFTIDALAALESVLNNGMPNNSANGLKFMRQGTNILVWTKDFPNDN